MRLTPDTLRGASRKALHSPYARFACFALAFGLLFAGADRALLDPDLGSSVWRQIREARRVPDVLIMGNSHAFCSFVPDILNAALPVDAAVLAASGQDGIGLTDSFETVLQVGAPRLLIVEINAFLIEPGGLASTHKVSTLDNINAMPGLWRRIQVAQRELGLESVPAGAFQLLRSDLMWARWARVAAPRNRNRYAGADVLGYQSLGWFATGAYNSAEATVSAAAKPTPMPAEMRAELYRLLTMARQHRVEVWLVKAPIAEREIPAVAELDALGELRAEFGDTLTWVYDACRELPALRFTAADFYDRGHLNRRGATKFTRHFTALMGERLQLQPDLQKPFAYLDERIEPLGDGNARWTMAATGSAVQYRFSLDSGEVLRDWTGDSSLIYALPPEQADRIRVSMCPAALLTQADVFALTLPFMTADRCVLQ